MDKIRIKDLEKNERVSFYDWLRILATFYVVVGHSFYLNNETVYGSIDYLQREGVLDIYNAPFYQNGLNVVAWIYGFHMPLFSFYQELYFV